MNASARHDGFSVRNINDLPLTLRIDNLIRRLDLLAFLGVGILDAFGKIVFIHKLYLGTPRLILPGLGAWTRMSRSWNIRPHPITICSNPLLLTTLLAVLVTSFTPLYRCEDTVSGFTASCSLHLHCFFFQFLFHCLHIQCLFTSSDKLDIWNVGVLVSLEYCIDFF